MRHHAGLQLHQKVVNAMSARIQFIVIASLLFAATQWRTWLFYLAPPPDFSHGKVVLYATDWCPYCEKTRAVLEAKKIAYTELNIETSAEGRKQYERLAGNGVPVLLVAGEVIRGYHETKIEATLTAWQQRQRFKNPVQ